MAHHATSVGNEFLALAAEEGRRLTAMQLLKLVYIAHGFHLGITGEDLVSDQPQAWRFGPVLPSLYHQCKQYGSAPIDQLIWPGNRMDLESEPPVKREFASRLLKQVWEKYGHLSGGALSDLTHRPGTPWDHAWNRDGGSDSRGKIIPRESIQSHYEHLLGQHGG